MLGGLPGLPAVDKVWGSKLLAAVGTVAETAVHGFGPTFFLC